VGRYVGPGRAPVLALAPLLILLGSAPAAGISPAAAAFPGASWSSSGSYTYHACAAGTLGAPSFSARSGIGHDEVAAAGSSCGKGKGGYLTDSVADLSSSLVVSVPVTLSSSNTGVRVAWNLTMRATDLVVHPGRIGCPVSKSSSHYSVGAPYNYTYWDNSSSSYCFALAQVLLSGTAYLLDTTTGASVYASNLWAGAENLSGFTVDTGRTVQSYAGNPAYWSYNSTSSYNNSAMYGASGSLSTHLTPTWWINGSFAAGDHYVVEAVLELGAYVEIYDAPHDRTQAVVDAKGSSGELRLASVTPL
jgi:hypothetical protein